MRQLPLLDAETYSPWSNIYTVGLSLAASSAEAGFLDWASNLAQLRDLKTQERRTTKLAPPSAQRRPSKYVRRLFIWGFIGTNAAVSIAWARAADEAAATGTTRLSPSLLRAAMMRAPGDIFYMAENLTLTTRGLRERRWWTLLTNAVSHVAPAHLILNMCAFYTWASRCFDLGMGPGSVAGLMLGSTLCCDVAGLANEPAGRPSMHIGASGLVSGLSQSPIPLIVMLLFFLVASGPCHVRYVTSMPFHW